MPVLQEGDTLELVTGFVTTEKASRDVRGGRARRVPGGWLEDITLCVVSAVGI